MVLFGNFFNGNALKGKNTSFKVGQKNTIKIKWFNMLYQKRDNSK